MLYEIYQFHIIDHHSVWRWGTLCSEALSPRNKGCKICMCTAYYQWILVCWSSIPVEKVFSAYMQYFKYHYKILKIPGRNWSHTFINCINFVNTELQYSFLTILNNIPGTANRTVASTNMNATSSRAHTVVTITFNQRIKQSSGSESKKSSVMNLVDLAGTNVF